jgi:probable HAF family extracellular repeat protein
MRRRRRLLTWGFLGIVAGLALLVWRLSAPAPWYRMTVFENITGGAIDPRALNDRGQVVGTMTVSGECHLFLWERAGGTRDLGPASGRECAINDAGQILATMIDPSGNLHTCLRDPNGTIQLLGIPGEATALNNRGQVVGSFWTRVDDTPREERHAFLWDRVTGLRDLGALGKTHSEALAVNDAGQVFGFCQSNSYPEEPREPCYWNPADPTAAAGIRLPNRTYTGLTNHGYIVGKEYFRDSAPYIVLWRDYTGLKKLFPHDSADDVFRLQLFVNDANQVVCVGEHHSPWERYSRRLFPVRATHFLWDPQRGKIPLDRYVTGLGSFEVRDLNNNGCILGVVHAEDGSSAAVLLEPIPERWAR